MDQAPDDEADATLDVIVAKASAAGLEALSNDEVEWLSGWLWENDCEAFVGHDFEALMYPVWSSEHAGELQGHVEDERLEALRDGAAPSKAEKQLFKKLWRKRMEVEPDDDWVPGLWECRVEASDGTAIRTVRQCWGSGWETNRTLVDIEPW